MSHRRSAVPHSSRPELSGPIHVVLRIRRGLPSLRTPRTYRVLERAFRLGKAKRGFALCEFSVQADHLHLIVEAEDRGRLARGMQGLAIRIAKSLNRFWRRRRGSVFAERFFARALKKPIEVWRAIRYVLQNGRKHGAWFSSSQPDPFSSGRWFVGWLPMGIHRPLRGPPVVRSSTLAMHCWRHMDLAYVPGQRLVGDAEPISWSSPTRSPG